MIDCWFSYSLIHIYIRSSEKTNRAQEKTFIQSNADRGSDSSLTKRDFSSRKLKNLFENSSPKIKIKELFFLNEALSFNAIES